MIIHHQTFGNRLEQHDTSKRRYDTLGGHRAQPIQYHPNSAIEALRKLEHQQSLESHPKQHSASRHHSDTHRVDRSQPVWAYQESVIEWLRKVEHHQTSEHRSEQQSSRRHHPSAREEKRSTKIQSSNKRSQRKPSAHYPQSSSKTGSSSSRDSSPCPDICRYRDLPEAVDSNIHHHPPHPHVYSTSNKRGLEQPSATQLAKRPRLNPGAYAVKYLRIDADESDIYSDGGESTDGSEYCD
jgi:hypothetical protein